MNLADAEDEHAKRVLWQTTCRRLTGLSRFRAVQCFLVLCFSFCWALQDRIAEIMDTWQLRERAPTFVSAAPPLAHPSLPMPGPPELPTQMKGAAGPSHVPECCRPTSTPSTPPVLNFKAPPACAANWAMPDCSGSSTGLEVRPQDQLQSTKDELSKLDRVNMDTVDRRFHNLEFCTHRATLDLGTLTCQVKQLAEFVKALEQRVQEIERRDQQREIHLGQVVGRLAPVEERLSKVNALEPLVQELERRYERLAKRMSQVEQGLAPVEERVAQLHDQWVASARNNWSSGWKARPWHQATRPSSGSFDHNT